VKAPKKSSPSRAKSASNPASDPPTKSPRICPSASPDCPENSGDCHAGDCGYYGIAPDSPDLSGVPQPICRVITELGILYNTAKTLQSGREIKVVLEQALEQMAQSLGLFHGALRVFNRANNETLVEVSCGLPAEDILGAKAPILEKTTQQVFATAIPLLVPDLDSPEKSLAVTELPPGQTSKLKVGDKGMLCVPVSDQTTVMGVLSIISRNKSDSCLESNLRLLTLIGQLIAQAVKIRQEDHEQVEYLRQENERLQHQLQQHFRPDNMIGNSRAMQTVYFSIEQVASSNTTVLLRGESGVGKELVAHAIHHRSPRSGKAFVKINCAALPESIVESELFGHERGAFTGAIAMRKGRFELAHHGTIFLDEIGELPLPTQAKLLRILQEREYERVGGTETLRCDVRVIAATNRQLEEFVEQGSFRQDLYYRLNVFPIYVPALRERKTDILQLSDFFVEKYNAANGKSIRRISTPAIDLLMSYHWPGNVRELENCMERASLLATDDVIHAYHLPPTLQSPSEKDDPTRSTLQAAIDGFEREMIIDALKAHRGNMAAAARQLGLTERIMGLRVKKHELPLDIYRSVGESG
jgi:Nif-specific regulatory protein